MPLDGRQKLQQEIVTIGVDVSVGIVEQDDIRTTGKCSNDRDALAIPRRQCLHSRIAHHGVPSSW